MITLNTQFVQDNLLYDIEHYFNSNNINSKHLKILAVNTNEYNNMIIDNTLNDLFKKALEFNITHVVLFDYHGWPIVPDNLNQNPIKTIALSYDFTLFNNPKKNSFYYPNWLFFTRNITSNKQLIVTHPISCAGRNFNNGRTGKIYNYQKLKNKKYFNQILFTRWRNFDFEYFSVPTEQEDPEFYSELTEFLVEYNTWEECNDINLSLLNSMTILDLDIYNKSLFHLVAESRITESLISEKTYKTFCSQQIPIFCAAQGTVAHLRALGFDMFDDIIDHNKYDTVNDWKQRILSMHSVLDEIINLNHNELLEITKQRRKQNFNQLASTEIDQQIYNPIIDALLK